MGERHDRFGAYLRSLRERRGLSLDAVAARSKALPQPISASYLSRCEHGSRLPGVLRLISLARVLDVPSQALIDRLDIEVELQRTGIAGTADHDLETLVHRVRTSFRSGRYLECFDAAATCERRFADGGAGRGRSSVDLDGVRICGAWSAVRLGRVDLSIHELRHVRRTAEAWYRRETASELLSSALLHRGNLVEAALVADEMEAAACERDDSVGRVKSLMRKAKIAERLGPSIALERYRDVERALRTLDVHDLERGRSGSYLLFGLGKCYRHLGRAAAARHATRAFLRRAREANLTNATDLARIQLGCLAADRDDDRSAHRIWSEAVESARARDARAFEFRAAYLLLELNERRGRATEAERLRDRLHDLFPWAGPGEREYEAYRRRQALARRGPSSSPGPRRPEPHRGGASSERTPLP